MHVHRGAARVGKNGIDAFALQAMDKDFRSAHDRAPLREALGIGWAFGGDGRLGAHNGKGCPLWDKPRTQASRYAEGVEQGDVQCEQEMIGGGGPLLCRLVQKMLKGATLSYTHKPREFLAHFGDS